MSIKKSFFNFFAVVSIAACGGGGGGAAEPAPVPAPPPAPTASISASPTTVYVDEDITLTWSSTNATSCEASDSWEGSKDTSGEEVVTATTNGDLTYTITCSGNGSAVASVSVFSEFSPQFKDDPIKIIYPNLYNQVCNTDYSDNEPSFHFVIPLNINNDGWDDFIMHQSCFIGDNFRGEEIAEPTPDFLIAFLSSSDGTYREANEEVFGQTIPSLGGASRKYDQGDLNGDGRDDFAFAMNWEDGRSGYPGENSRASPAILLSKGDSEYEIVKVGNPDWGHAVDIIENNDGSVDAVFMGYTGVGLQAYRYKDDAFINVRNNYPYEVVWGDDGSVARHGTSRWATEFRHYSNYIVAADSSDAEDEEAEGIALWKRNENNWVKIDQKLNQVQYKINFTTWQGNISSLGVYEYKNGYVADFTPQTICFFEDKIDDENKPTFLALYLTYTLKEGEIEEGGSYRFDDFWETQAHKFFQIVDDKIVEIESVLDAYDDKLFANFIDCRDMNNDGYTDFSRRVWSKRTAYETPRERGGTPIIHINNKLGEMIEYESNRSYEMPGHSLLMDANQGQGYFRDVNNDGVEDLVLFGMSVDSQYSSYDGSIEVYLGEYGFILK